MVIGNGSGDIPSDLDSFDSLPVPIKRVLHCAPRPYAASRVREAWMRIGGSSVAYAKRMEAKLQSEFPGWKPDLKYTRSAF